MKVEILNEKQNTLLHRKEYDVAISEYSSTPSRSDVVAAISAQLGAAEGLVSIDKIDQGYGKQETRCHVKVYESTDLRKKYEFGYRIDRLAGKKEAKEEKEEKPAKAKEEKKEGE